jgi:hypothetical protein
VVNVLNVSSVNRGDHNFVYYLDSGDKSRSPILSGAFPALSSELTFRAFN